MYNFSKLWRGSVLSYSVTNLTKCVIFYCLKNNLTCDCVFWIRQDTCPQWQKERFNLSLTKNPLVWRCEAQLAERSRRLSSGRANKSPCLNLPTKLWWGAKRRTEGSPNTILEAWLSITLIVYILAIAERGDQFSMIYQASMLLIT